MGTAGMERHVDGAAPKRARLSAPERRETILRAAAEVFGQEGYRAGKVADVARYLRGGHSVAIIIAALTSDNFSAHVGC